MADEIPRLVLLEWLDSRQPVSLWCRLDDFPEASATRCQSVGWLIRDDDMKVLCQTVGDIDDETAQGMGFLQIPACAVVKITTISSLAPVLT